MKTTNPHWTSINTDKFLYRIASDFVEQIRDRLDELKWTQKRFANELNVSPGRISQVFNNPGNLTLETMVEWARAIGMKVSILAYQDNDPFNEFGPINSEIFRRCWVNAGLPRDFSRLRLNAIQEVSPTSTAILELGAQNACSSNHTYQPSVRLTAPLSTDAVIGARQ